LALGAYGLGILPVNWFGLVFLALAFVLFVLDVKAPTHGALTAAGLGSFILGALVLFNSPGTPSFQRVSVPLVVTMGALERRAMASTTAHPALLGNESPPVIFPSPPMSVYRNVSPPPVMSVFAASFVGLIATAPFAVTVTRNCSNSVGTEIVAKAAPDGYTVLVTDSALLMNPGLFKAKMPFDTQKSFSGLTMMANAPVILVIHPAVPAQNLSELLALARSRPGYLNYASGGYGTSTHLAAELMKLAAKVFIVHIPYKGTGPAMTDLLAGQVQMQFAGISSARSQVEAGKLRAIAVTGKQRNPAMPSVPTFEESGLTRVDADTYWGVYAPAGVPPAVLARLNKAFVEALRSPAHAERLAALGFLPIANTVQEHTQQMQAMIARWTEVIDKAGIKVE